MSPLILVTCLLAAAHALLVSYPLTSLFELKTTFEFQHSYDKAEFDPTYVSASSNGLLLSVYPGDKAFKVGSPTDPRNELRLLGSFAEGTDYSYSIDQLITQYVPDYQFSFMQLFGATGPNILIRFRSGAYQIVTRNGNVHDTTGVKPMTNVWTSWQVKFKLTNDNTGYVHLYRNGILFLAHEGPSSVGGQSIAKFGIYSQQPDVPAPIHMQYKKFMLQSCNAIGQLCGGIGYTGPTCCARYASCSYVNSSYARCIDTHAAAAATEPTTTLAGQLQASQLQASQSNFTCGMCVPVQAA